MTAVLSSCACKEMETNMANLAKIRVGMDKEQVLKIMGPPEIYTLSLHDALPI